MKYRQLGKWGVRLSEVGLGSYLTIGMHVDDQGSLGCVRRCFDLGVNFFDTANAYNVGQAEEVLGRCLAEHPRDSYVLATKVFAPMGDGPNDRGLSAKHIFEQCHASLSRLGVDYVDMYQCHREDPSVPLEETVRAMEDLARQGKILYWGTSEWSASSIAQAQAVARGLGARPIASNQPRYNLMYRYPEREVFPLCQQEGIGQVVFSPLAHGVLTGKYKPGQPALAGTRAADRSQNGILRRMYWGKKNLERVQQMVKLARRLGCKPSQLALAWALRHPALTSVIIGATRPEQIDENVKAADVRIDDATAAKLDALFPVPTDYRPVG
jgi:voltage-dependent potassium channel beta subunit